MRKESKMLEKLRAAELSTGCVLPGLPILELSGDRRLLIENHQGVMQYSLDTIGIKVQYGEIIVCGCGLELQHMNKARLLICGRIDAIHVERKGSA